MAATLIPLGDVGRRGAPQIVEASLLALVIQLKHVVPQRSFPFALSLRMIDRGMKQPEPSLSTERVCTLPVKYGPVSSTKAWGIVQEARIAAIGAQMVVLRGTAPNTSQNTEARASSSSKAAHRAQAEQVEKRPRFQEGTAVRCSSRPHDAEGFSSSVSLATLFSV
jgi:hypothetical protein